MSSNGTKLSFSFAPPTSSSSKSASTSNTSTNNASSSTPKSNFELLLAKSKAPQKPSPSTGPNKKPAFSFDEDDDEVGNALAGPSKPKPKAKAPVGQTNLLSRNERKALKMAESIDQSIFNYDEHYESMKSAERLQEENKKKESEERKPKYIESFLASAQTRKLDKLRAEEKALQRERENEGDEFEGKEKFVTDNYKRQMEEVRKAEEEERKREEELRKTRSGPGLTAFYKSMLESSEAENAAAVAATSGPSSVAGQGPSLAIRPPSGPSNKPEYDDEEEYDPLLAREAKAQAQAQPSGSSNTGGGGNDKNPDVEINDEGEIVDKRSLLKAGLNITKKPKPPALPNSLLSGQRSGEVNEGPYKSRAVGTAASYSERMERERRRLAHQMREQAERKRKEEEEKVRVEEEEARRRREGDNGDAERKRQEARERFLARKRQREEDEREKREKKAREE
ncbi:hypothetical protein I302_103682 [Kwoniella bestiolae CBS 10118]|uniref:Nuclear speckle splicing regulatory protein 1 N-terminal domain-containing protein n=1 Tax=Kwoniella bestiolae CBS 10118 TaxID=1296100 RepID=A0A1B9G923_9TREE|nr:hypothetical protein I302_02387 [Kwoniella bestiolae CBS 10118]OCF27545.1 hypothetical protein I302_02387 [Kwoniella bestiolae CBS 10118]